jgi:hypothetical protein
MQKYESYTKNEEFDAGNFAIAAEKYLEILKNNDIILAYDENSILQLDFLFKATPFGEEDYFAFLMGSFFGKCLIEILNKQWAFDTTQQRWVVSFSLKDGNASMNVFKKIYARMAEKDLDDSSESISAYYRYVQSLVENDFKLPSIKNKPSNP